VEPPFIAVLGRAVIGAESEPVQASSALPHFLFICDPLCALSLPGRLISSGFLSEVHAFLVSPTRAACSASVDFCACRYVSNSESGSDICKGLVSAECRSGVVSLAAEMPSEVTNVLFLSGVREAAECRYFAV
jgi:hypothetical protein